LQHLVGDLEVIHARSRDILRMGWKNQGGGRQYRESGFHKE
jgi:hypothetical protein